MLRDRSESHGRLVVSRKTGERVLIGDDVIVEVVEHDRSRVRIAVTAPREVRVLREELADDS